MSFEWTARHAQGACTDSRTLPSAAFPSLPLNRPPPPAPAPKVRKDSAVNLTESDKEDAIPNSTQSDEFDTADDSSKDFLDEDASSKIYINQTLSPEQQEVNDATVAGNPKAPKLSAEKRPRSINCEDLRFEHTSLTNKRRMFEFQLRRLGYAISHPASSSNASAAATPDWTQTPTSIDALWRAVQELRTVNHALEVRENHAHQTTSARRRLFTRLPGYQERLAAGVERGDALSPFRPGAVDTVLHGVGCDGDADSDDDGDMRVMRTTARRYACPPLPTTTTANTNKTSTTIADPPTQAYGEADCTRTSYVSSPAVALQRPLTISKRRRSYNLARWGPSMGAHSLSVPAGGVPLGIGALINGDGRDEDEDNVLAVDSGAAWNQHQVLQRAV